MYNMLYINNMKTTADITIEYTNNTGYTIRVHNKDIIVKGRGVQKVHENGMISVTDNMMNKLQGLYNVECNF